MPNCASLSQSRRRCQSLEAAVNDGSTPIAWHRMCWGCSVYARGENAKSLVPTRQSAQGPDGLMLRATSLSPNAVLHLMGAMFAVALLWCSPLGTRCVARTLSAGASFEAGTAGVVSVRGKLPKLDIVANFPGPFVQLNGAHPFVVIDLGRVRRLISVRVINAVDNKLGQNGGLNLELRLTPNVKAPTVETRPPTSIRTWDMRFLGRSARFVRLELPRDGALNLVDVEVFGW
jgi:hypothetical protein